ncbi:ead/Ea22-like family protein [Raoultella planticola]|nr:ead/Ea22-like family protein [Raoultella planticola]
MKAAAVRAKAATEDYVAHRMSITVCLEECKEFNDLSDGPDNILALVEALEKAQRHANLTEAERQAYLGLISKRDERMAELEPIRVAAEKLVRCKGRYHSELNYRALAALFGVTTPDLPPLEHENVHYADAAEVEIATLRQRIAELESRTVKMPEPFKLAKSSSGLTYYYADEVNEALSAAGIKWEAE